MKLRQLAFVALIAFISTVGLVSAKTCVTSADCTTTRYCKIGSPGTCERITFSDAIGATGDPASDNPNESFSIVMFSDIQYYYLVCKDEPYKQCIFRGVKGTNDRELALLKAADGQRDCVNALYTTKLSNVKAVFDNGDLTNEGDDQELKMISDMHEKITDTGAPLVVSLGNHDYAWNTQNPNWDKNNIQMIEYFESMATALTSKLKVRSADFSVSLLSSLETESGKPEKHMQGSLGYSIEINDYLFIMTHWAGTVSTGAFTTKYVHDDNGTVKYVHILSVLEWLKDELDYADKNGKTVCIVPHSWCGFHRFVTNEGLEQRIYESNIAAVFSGHDHDAFGPSPDWVVSGTISGVSGSRNVPVYYAGSASYQKLIAVSFKPAKGGIDSVDVYDTAAGAACAVTKDTSPNNDPKYCLDFMYTPAPSTSP